MIFLPLSQPTRPMKRKPACLLLLWLKERCKIRIDFYGSELGKAVRMASLTDFTRADTYYNYKLSGQSKQN